MKCSYGMQASSIPAGVVALCHSNNKMQNFDQSEPQHEGVPCPCASPWLRPLPASCFHWQRAVHLRPCMQTISVSATPLLKAWHTFRPVVVPVHTCGFLRNSLHFPKHPWNNHHSASECMLSPPSTSMALAFQVPKKKVALGT